MNMETIGAGPEDEVAHGSQSEQAVVASGWWGKRWVLGVAVLAAGVAIAVPQWLIARGNAPVVEAAALPVKTTLVKSVNSFTVARTYTGEVTATRTSELGFERSGTLIWVGIDQGDRVQHGDAIARLDTQNQVAQLNQLRAQKAQAEAVLQELRNGPRVESIATAQAQVSDLQNQLALEEIRRDRREVLYREGAISREQLDEVAYNRNALQNRLSAAQSQLAELKNGTRVEQIAAQHAVIDQLNAGIADVEITIAKSTLIAPFTGVIGERRLDEGTVINAGQAIARLVENDAPEVEVGVPTDVVASLPLGSSQMVQIGGNSFPATVMAIKPEVNSTTRTQTVVLALSSADGVAIAPAQIAQLNVTQSISAQGFWLPTTALTHSDRGLWSCFALNNDRVERRDVEVLHTDGDRVLVRGLLQTGDRIVTEGVQRLVPGQIVRSDKE